MKFLPSQLLYFVNAKSSQRNLVALGKFFLFLVTVIVLYSVLFHVLMLYEGRDYSWVTGIYWTLTVMSTLGFGDITFHSDMGLVFTLIVLLSGVVFLLIMLPFTFIQFFYAPWIEAQKKNRTPREVPEGTKGHIIITNIDPVTNRLVEKLKRRGFDYVLIVSDVREGLELHDAGFKVVVGEPDDPDTYLRVRVEDAAYVVITNDDMMSTNISFTIRGITKKVPIITGADKEYSLDILKFPGNTKVFLFMKMLGESLAERVLGLGRKTKIVSSYEDLMIAEIPVSQTSLGGQSLADTNIRPKTGVTIVGLWNKGRFEAPHPKTVIDATSNILLAGTNDQLDLFENRFTKDIEETETNDAVLILGGGRVGDAAGKLLASYGANYKIIEKRPNLVSKGGDNYILGDAADKVVLTEAGIESAKTAIITTHNDAANIYLTFYCRQLRPDIQIISRATTERSVVKLHMAGADLVMSYSALGTSSIMKEILPNEVSSFAEGMNFFSHSIPKSLIGKNLAESNIRQETGCSVVALKVKGKLLAGPDPTVPLGSSTELLLIGDADSEKIFDEIYV
ncbi:MAG: NAD-binding protein [Desulfotalea sp.]